ncbi:hypothetical protein SAMN05216436_11066 [bacterium A37T11]|nr:hypothetical protein SAMN05216436_11066 [bacterium A37T11]
MWAKSRIFFCKKKLLVIQKGLEMLIFFHNLLVFSTSKITLYLQHIYFQKITENMQTRFCFKKSKIPSYKKFEFLLKYFILKRLL